MKRFLMSAALAAVALAASPAAAVTFTTGAMNSGPVDVTSQYQTYTLYDFNSGTSPFTGGAVRSGSSALNFDAPTGDTTPYFSVGPSTSSPATLMVTGINQVSLYWGSIDAYNKITFLGLGQSFTGTDIDPSATGAGSNSREVTFKLSASEAAALTGIQLSSTSNAFELDNFIVGTAVPEPATYGIMTLGLGLVGGVLRRRRKQDAGSLSFA